MVEKLRAADGYRHAGRASEWRGASGCQYAAGRARLTVALRRRCQAVKYVRSLSPTASIVLDHREELRLAAPAVGRPAQWGIVSESIVRTRARQWCKAWGGLRGSIRIREPLAVVELRDEVAARTRTNAFVRPWLCLSGCLHSRTSMQQRAGTAVVRRGPRCSPPGADPHTHSPVLRHMQAMFTLCAASPI